MTIRQLIYFREIARQQSYTTASRNLYIAQSALSVSMKKLEDELGCTLFVSNGRSIILTDSGKKLLEHTEKFLETYENFRSDAYAISEKTFGQLRIGVPHFMDKCIFGDLLAGFCEKYPDMQISIVNDGARNIQYRVRTQDVNLGFALSPILSDLNYKKCIETDMVVVMSESNQLATNDVIEVGMLKDQKLISLGTEHEVFFILKGLFADSGNSLKPSITASNTSFIFDLIRRGLGVSVQSRLVAESLYRENDTVVIKPLECGKKIWTLGLVYPKRELYQSEKLFLEYFDEHYPLRRFVSPITTGGGEIQEQ